MLRKGAIRLLAAVDRLFATDLETGTAIGFGLGAHVVGLRQRAWALAAGFLLGSGLWKRPVRLALRAPGGGAAVFTFPDYWALLAAAEILLWDEYDIAVAEPPRTVLDLGAHIGLSALFFRRRWPEARIVAVEASPHNAALLRENTRGLGVEVVHAAVGVSDAPVRFADDAPSWAGSTVTGDGDRTVTVPGVTLDELIDDSVDFVKLDIEGAELDVVPASSKLAHVPTVVGEIHAPPGSRETAAVLARLPGSTRTKSDPGGYFTTFRAAS